MTGLQIPMIIDGKILTLADIERRAIDVALTISGGNKDAAARMLGIGRSTLYRRLEDYEGSKIGAVRAKVKRRAAQ